MKKKANYFQPEQIAAIRDALETEPIKWRTLVHMRLITGARRGEIPGLKWEKVYFVENQVQICNNVLYRADRGVMGTRLKLRSPGGLSLSQRKPCSYCDNTRLGRILSKK